MSSFDLTYEIVDWEVLSIEGDTARVRVVQITRTKRPNSDFRDNKLEAVKRHGVLYSWTCTSALLTM